MATRIVSQSQSLVLERECDGCGKTEQFETAFPEGSPEAQQLAQKVADWYRVGRRIPTEGGEFKDLGADACSLECLAPAAVKRLLLPESTPIDLASLQVNRDN
jgi:hypothetical protein